MKYIVVLGDGMADEPIESLGGKTPLEAANTPVMEELSKVSEIGLCYTIPEGMSPGSDTANLAVMGYDPKKYYTGRSPLEALSIGVDLKDTDVAIRSNLVTLSEENVPYEERTILDHSSGEICTEDAAVLIEALKEGLSMEEFQLYVGTSYRHLLIWEHGRVAELTPPHDILTKRIGDYLPKEECLKDLMKKSFDILNHHPINEERRRKGLNPANSAWFWGAGTKPALDDFTEKTGKIGAMVSAVDLLKGIAVGAGMRNLKVEGATGGLHTNYEGKAQAGADALRRGGYDFVYIHVEAPDEMGHQGDLKAKIKAIENLDQRLIAPLKKEMEESGEAYRILIMPDHPTPIRLRTHTGEPVPYLLYDSTCQVQGLGSYDEKNAKKSGRVITNGYELMNHFLEKE